MPAEKIRILQHASKKNLDNSQVILLKSDRVEHTHQMNVQTIPTDDISPELHLGHKSALSGGGNGTRSNHVISNSAMIKQNKLKKGGIINSGVSVSKNLSLLKEPLNNNFMFKKSSVPNNNPKLSVSQLQLIANQ